MGFRSSDIVVTLILNVIQTVYTQHILSCNITDIQPCPGENQICKEASKQCECLDGFVQVGADCVPSSGDIPSNHNSTVAVVTIFTLALLVCGLILVIRKYNLIDYVRQKINHRRSNDVMYEDVMIGQDDPPLSP